MATNVKTVYDFLVIGGGSGGIASARRAASYGAKTAVIESGRLGGTLGFVLHTVLHLPSLHYESDTSEFNAIRVLWCAAQNLPPLLDPSSLSTADSDSISTLFVLKTTMVTGTCVNVGCVPKKVMWNTATLAESIHDAKEYGFDIDASTTKFDWSVIKTSRDAYIKRLNVRRENRQLFSSPQTLTLFCQFSLNSIPILFFVRFLHSIHSSYKY